MHNKLEEAMLRVQEMRKLIASQSAIVAKLKAKGEDATEAERLLAEYKASKAGFKDELNRLLRKATS